MSRLSNEEAVEEVLSGVKMAGCAVTQDQLHHWQSRAVGLIPAPRQVSHGRHGTEVYYPAGTTSQVIAVCQLQKRIRSLKAIKLELWWLGYPVTARMRNVTQVCINNWQFIRQYMVEPVTEFGSDGTKYRYEQLVDNMLTTLEGLAEMRLMPPLSSVRDRVGRSEISAFIYMVLDALMLDALRPGEPRDFGLRDVGLGLVPSIEASRTNPIFVDDIDNEERLAPYKFLSRTCTPEALQEALDHTSDADLLIARDDFIAFLQLGTTITSDVLTDHTRAQLGLLQRPMLPPLDRDTRQYLYTMFLAWRRDPAFQQLRSNATWQLLIALVLQTIQAGESEEGSSSNGEDDV